MNRIIIILSLFLFIFGCTILEESSISNSYSNINSINLLLNETEIYYLGLEKNETICNTEEYETSEFSPLKQESICFYSTEDGTEIVIQIKKYTNYNDLNGTYQYTSSHLRSSQGIISENEFGDQSKFSSNHEDDYGAEFNEQGVYYYYLWFTKDLYLIHITSKGSEDAKEYVKNIGNQILVKFG